MILVVGGGVPGLSFAACSKGDVVVCEGADAVGGYCRTTIRNGYVWDRAGHFFHFRNPSVRAFFDENIDSSRFVKVEKKTGIYIDTVGFIDFPFQKNIHQLPKALYIKCLIDLYKASKSKIRARTFKEFVYSTVGKEISDLFLIPYNQKLYACDLDELDSNAMGRFFPKATFEEVLLNAESNDNSSYNTEFSYPKGGAEEFVSVLQEKAQVNADIRLNSFIQGIDIENKVATLSSGERVQYDVLINTMPFNRLCRLIGEEGAGGVLSANKVAVFNLGFDSKVDDEHHWLYYPGDEVFYRVGCYHNIFQDERASLYVEIGLKADEAIDEKQLLGRVLSDLCKVGLTCSSMKLVDYEFVLMDPAYVHINEASEVEKTRVKSVLAKKGVYTAGRYGDWKYCSIEDNIVEAANLARLVSQENGVSEFVNVFGLIE